MCYIYTFSYAQCIPSLESSPKWQDFLIKRYGLHDLLFSFSTSCHGGGTMAGSSASYDKIEDTIVKLKVDSTMEKDTAIPYLEVLQLLRIVL